MVYHYDIVNNKTLRPLDMSPCVSRGSVTDISKLMYSVTSAEGVCGSPSFDQTGKVFGIHVATPKTGKENFFEDVSQSSALYHFLSSAEAKNLRGIATLPPQ
jgi:hypothetical protein